MRGRMKENDSSVAHRKGNYAYSTHFDMRAESPLFIRTPRAGGKEQVLLSVNTQTSSYNYFYLGQTAISPYQKVLA